MRQTCARLYALGHLSKKAINARIADIRQGKDAVVAAHMPLPHCGLVPVDLPDGGSDCGPDCGTAKDLDFAPDCGTACDLDCAPGFGLG